MKDRMENTDTEKRTDILQMGKGTLLPRQTLQQDIGL